jgi:hypothetical protein
MLQILRDAGFPGVVCPSALRPKSTGTARLSLNDYSTAAGKYCWQRCINMCHSFASAKSNIHTTNHRHRQRQQQDSSITWRPCSSCSKCLPCLPLAPTIYAYLSFRTYLAKPSKFGVKRKTCCRGQSSRFPVRLLSASGCHVLCPGSTARVVSIRTLLASLFSSSRCCQPVFADLAA